jgi:hypothetical protein
MHLSKKQLDRLIELSKVLSKDEFEQLLRNKILTIDKNVALSSFEDLDEELFISESPFDNIEFIERIIFQIENIELVKILVLKFLGYKSKEISKILGRSMATYYILCASLKKEVERIIRNDEKMI